MERLDSDGGWYYLNILDYTQSADVFIIIYTAYCTRERGCQILLNMSKGAPICVNSAWRMVKYYSNLVWEIPWPYLRLNANIKRFFKIYLLPFYYKMSGSTCVSESVSEWVSQSVSDSVSPSASQPSSQPGNKHGQASQPSSQSISQSVS